VTCGKVGCEVAEELATMKPTHHFVPSVRFRKAKSTARNHLYKD